MSLISTRIDIPCISRYDLYIYSRHLVPTPKITLKSFKNRLKIGFFINCSNFQFFSKISKFHFLLMRGLISKSPGLHGIQKDTKIDKQKASCIIFLTMGPSDVGCDNPLLNLDLAKNNYFLIFCIKCKKLKNC